jgi:hypothetical protein
MKQGHMNATIRLLAAEVMARTIHAHYVHGLEHGARLNLEQIAGESVEAAIALDQALESEASTGSVSHVMALNRAARAGYAAAMAGHASVDIINEDGDADIAQAAQDGYTQGLAAKAKQGN